MNEIYNRAVAAHFRTAGKVGGVAMQPSQSDSGVEEHGGKQHVVLRSVNGLLAVYRVNTDGILKRLARWPKTITEN